MTKTNSDIDCDSSSDEEYDELQHEYENQSHEADLSHLSTNEDDEDNEFEDDVNFLSGTVYV